MSEQGIPYVDPFPPARGPFTGGALVGLHLTWPVPNTLIDGVLPYLGTLKGVTGTGGNLRHAKALKPDLLVVYRDYRVEHPADFELLGGRKGAQMYADRLLAVWEDANVLDVADYLEVMNEWTIPASWYPILAEFSVYLAERLAERGMAILTGGFAPGCPEPEEFAALYPYLRWVDGHPAGAWPDGSPKYHGVSLHLAGFMPPGVTSPRMIPWIGDPWVAGRYQVFDQALRARHSYSLRDFKGPLLATELYYGYGFAGEEDVWTTEQLRAGVRETARRLSADGIVDGFHIWSVGKVANWVDLSGHLPGMVE